MRSVEQLTKEAEERMGEQASRIACYQTFLDAWSGERPNGGGGLGEVIANNADGRPALRLAGIRSDLAARTGAPNLLAPMIDDLTAIRGAMPRIAVLPHDNTDQAREMAVKRSRILRTVWEQSDMDVNQLLAAFYLSCLGDVVYTLDPVLEERPGNEVAEDPFFSPGLYITVTNPMFCYPRFRTGRNSRELEDIYIVREMSLADAHAIYGERANAVRPGGKKQVRVIFYYGRNEKQAIIAGANAERLDGIEHNLGFCTAQWVCNKPGDGRQAQADIARAVEVHREFQDMYYVFTDSLVQAVYPILHVRNAMNVAGDEIRVGPGAKIETQQDGAVELIAPAANPAAAKMIMETTQDALFKIVGVSPIRIEGMIDRSNVSARSVDRQQAPMETRLGMANTILGAHLEKLNAKIMLMYWKVEGLRDEVFSIYGVEKGGTVVTDTFTGADFGGWYRNTVKWDALAGLNRHERVVIMLQLFKEKLVDGAHVLEQAGEEDPEATLDAAQKFWLNLARLEAAAQGGAPGGAAPGGSPGGDPTQAAQEGMALAQGGLGAPPGGAPAQPPPAGPPGMLPGMGGGGGAAPLPMPGFPPVAAPPNALGMGPPPDLPDVVAIIDRALARIPRLFGRITVRQAVPGGILIKLTDHRDIQNVRNYLRGAAEEIAGPGAKVKAEIDKAAAA
jgi:hypothetical protein